MGNLCGAKPNTTRGTLRVLVLGISGSGKSTFAKQMKIIHTEGFSDNERKSYCGVLRNNILSGMRELADTIFAKEMDVTTDNRKHIRFFRETNVFEINLCDEKVVKKVKSLWKDPIVQEVWESSKNIQTQVSQLDYLVENIDRFVSPEFVPSDEDMLRSRQRTSGAHSTRFLIDKYMCEIVDVGGQLPERAKWGTVVRSGVHSIIFFASLDEYNMESTEEQGKTKMEVSLEVFKQVALDEETKQKCIILFLNKKDLFKQKISTKSGLADFYKKFPKFRAFRDSEYVLSLHPDQRNDLESLGESEKLLRAAIQFIENMFRAAIITDEKNVEQVKAVTEMPVKHTCAIDTKHIQEVFNAIKDKIFLNRMFDSGINV